MADPSAHLHRYRTFTAGSCSGQELGAKGCVSEGNRGLIVQVLKRKLKQAALLNKVYYPGARQRLGDLCERYPQGKQFPGAEHQPDLLFVRIEDPKPDEYGLRNEAFGPALYEVEVDSGSDANTFLEKAAELVNSDRIWGSLSMVASLANLTRPLLSIPRPNTKQNSKPF
jgi:hypothetical protein